MAFERSDKETVLEALMAARRQGQLAETSLRFQRKTDEAERLWEANARISTEIDILIGRMMKDWLGRAEQAMGDLSARNAELEAAVDEIKKQIKVAQNVVKIVGLLDNAVAIAKKAIAGL